MAAQSSALGDEQQARCHTHPRIKLNPTEGNPAMTNSMQIGKVVHTFIDAYGFDPTHIYCQVTGKPIAQTHSEEFEALVDSLGVVDAEQAADDLAVRLLASMRPSMRWNVFRDDSLVIMRQKHPVETLAYLLNRMFAPLNFRKISRRDLLADLEHRIKTFQIISEWDKASHFDTLIYMLLELDAKWSLDTESAPFNWQDFFVTADTMDARALPIGTRSRRRTKCRLAGCVPALHSQSPPTWPNFWLLSRFPNPPLSANQRRKKKPSSPDCYQKSSWVESMTRKRRRR
jgi:hypothetical protein